MKFKATIPFTHPLVLIVPLVLIIIVFESFQSLFYIGYYGLDYRVDFLIMFKEHALKWLVWLMMSYFLMIYVRKLALKDNLQVTDFYTVMLLIVVLICVVNFINANVSVLKSDQPYSFSSVMPIFQFSSFQKMPIFSFGYTCFAVIVYYYYNNIKLHMEVLEAGDLKRQNQELYNKLSQSTADKSPVLNIKVGNKHKILSIEKITWVEADDYCVNIHSQDLTVYSMRTSLKALEKKLPQQFLRVHRGAIVNMVSVKEMVCNGANQLILLDGSHVSVANSQLKKVKCYLVNNSV